VARANLQPLRDQPTRLAGFDQALNLRQSNAFALMGRRRGFFEMSMLVSLGTQLFSRSEDLCEQRIALVVERAFLLQQLR
jgi:hypothetical protein